MQRSWNKHLSHPKEADLFAENATLTFVPTAAGATGKQEISNYLAKCTKLDALQFVVSIADTLGNKGPITLQPGGTVLKSRTVAEGTIVEELLVRLSHDEEIAWLLPGVRPTSKELCFPMVVVATFVKDKISSKRLYWDQATVLKQAGLLPTDRDYAATKNAMIVPALNAAEISTRFMDESNNDNVNVLEKIIASLPAAGEHVPPATGVHLAHSVKFQDLFNLTIIAR
jgi:carboxymethylenebutenolidase